MLARAKKEWTWIQWAMGLHGQMLHCPQNNRIYARNKDSISPRKLRSPTVKHAEVVHVAVTVSCAKKFPLIFLPKGGLMNADCFVETVLPEISKNIPLANFRDRNWIFMWDLARGIPQNVLRNFAASIFRTLCSIDFIPPIALRSCRRTFR